MNKSLRHMVEELIWPLIVDYGADTGGVTLQRMQEHYVDTILALVAKDRAELVKALEDARLWFDFGEPGVPFRRSTTSIIAEIDAALAGEEKK